MNKLLLTLALFSFSIHSFADEKPLKSIPKGTVAIGLQPAFKANKYRLGIGGNTRLTNRLGMGLSPRYYVAKNFGVQAIIAYTRFSEETDFGNGTIANKIAGLDLGIGIVKPIFLFSFNSDKGGAIFLIPEVKADFFTGNSNTTTPINTTKRDATGFQIGAFLGIEWFTKPLGVNQLSLQAAFGILGFTNSDIGGNETKNTWAFSPVNPQPGSLNMLNATFGFHYYFF